MTPAACRPLTADQLTFLRWLVAAPPGEPRLHGQSPPDLWRDAFQIRRALLRAGLMAYGSDDTGLHSRCTMLPTDAGRRAAAA